MKRINELFLFQEKKKKKQKDQWNNVNTEYQKMEESKK